MDVEGKRLMCEMALVRWCCAHIPLTEQQVHEMTMAKQRLMVGFNPDDIEVGYRWFAEKLREAGRSV